MLTSKIGNNPEVVCIDGAEDTKEVAPETVKVKDPIEDSNMVKGTVKVFYKDKGYGFITANEGEKDYFFHFSSINSLENRSVDEGQWVAFEIIDGPRGRKEADNIIKL